MNSAPKPSSLQTYRMLVFRRALHPEFLQVMNRRAQRSSRYEIETWLGPGAHMVRFQVKGECIVEVVTPGEDHFPDQGLSAWFPCAGERDHEEWIDDRARYLTSVHTEVQSDNIYKATLLEMQDFAFEQTAQVHRWRDDGCRHDSLSLLDVQVQRDSVHADAWHLDATCGLVVRSQALLELKRIT